MPHNHHHRNKISATMAVVLLAIFFCNLSLPASAESSKKNKPSASSFSYLYYHPEQSDFPAHLRPFVKQIEHSTLPLPLSHPEKTVKHDYDALISKVVLTMQSMNRAEHHRAYFLLGYLYELNGNTIDAMKAYESSVKLRSDNPLSVFRQAVILIEQNKISSARNCIQELLWRSPNAAEELYYLLAMCAKTQEDDDALLKYLTKAIEINSHFTLARISLLKYYDQVSQNSTDPSKRNEIEASIYNNLKTIYETDPDNREIALKYAEHELAAGDPLFQAGRMQKAEKIAKSLCDSSDYKDAEAVSLLARIQIKKGNLKKAQEIITSGLSKNPDSKILLESKRQLSIEYQFKTESTNSDDN